MNIETTYINDDGRQLIIVHADNPHIDSNTLCGLDFSGDHLDNVAYNSVDTKSKINCDSCISMIKYCKSIKSNSISTTELSVDGIYDEL